MKEVITRRYQVSWTVATPYIQQSRPKDFDTLEEAFDEIRTRSKENREHFTIQITRQEIPWND